MDRPAARGTTVRRDSWARRAKVAELSKEVEMARMVEMAATVGVGPMDSLARVWRCTRLRSARPTMSDWSYYASLETSNAP